MRMNWPAFFKFWLCVVLAGASCYGVIRLFPDPPAVSKQVAAKVSQLHGGGLSPIETSFILVATDNTICYTSAGGYAITPVGARTICRWRDDD